MQITRSSDIFSRLMNIKGYLVFKVLLLQVLHIRDHLMDDWVEHGLEKQTNMKR